ncbi:MAG: sulfocyanin-like copper-binding protein [Anaerolineales bacterium]
MLHEFIIIQTDLPADELPTDEMTGRVVEDSVTIITAAEDIPPSDSRDLTVNLGAGHYVMVCNLPGHYQQGMHMDFTVTRTSNELPSTPESTAQPTDASAVTSAITPEATPKQ